MLDPERLVSFFYEQVSEIGADRSRKWLMLIFFPYQIPQDVHIVCPVPVLNFQQNVVLIFCSKNSIGKWRKQKMKRKGKGKREIESRKYNREHEQRQEKREKREEKRELRQEKGERRNARSGESVNLQGRRSYNSCANFVIFLTDSILKLRTSWKTSIVVGYAEKCGSLIEIWQCRYKKKTENKQTSRFVAILSCRIRSFQIFPLSRCDPSLAFGAHQRSMFANFVFLFCTYYDGRSA